MGTVLEAEIEAHLDDALDRDDLVGRYAALLDLYLRRPEGRTDLLFVAMARRLAESGITPSDRASSSSSEGSRLHPDAGELERVAQRREDLLVQHRSMWERLTGFLPRRVRS